jgi:hypothetical protein
VTDRLGPYELRGELGRGAMAIVWRGYDPKLDREVAIKEPTVPPGTPPAAAIELSERFVREGRTAAALNHPGIVTVFAADVYDGRPAIVMELIEGETLASILERGPLPPSAALSVLSQLLDAVAYAHERGVVHRDIKPDNVFVTTDGRVKLADFGIAHIGGTSALTQAGTIMGTPGYMAPEQVTGEAVDARADIFSIGAVAHEMLSGSNPFGATDGAAPTTVLYRIVHEPAPPLPPSIDASLPAGLAAVLGHAMAKDPAMRFESASAFRAALNGGVVPAGGFAPAAAATVVSQKPGAGTTNWTPYLIVGAVMIVVLGLLMAFAGGGGAQGGGVPAANTAAASASNQSAAQPSGPSETSSRAYLTGTYTQLAAYGTSSGSSIKALVDRFNRGPGASATLSQAQDLLSEIQTARSQLASTDVASSLQPVKDKQLQCFDYCVQRVQAIVDGCNAAESGGDYVSAVAAGHIPNQEFQALYPQARP